MSKADERFWLRTRHAEVSDRLATLKATQHPHTDAVRNQIEGCVESLQFFERELEALGKV